MSDLVDYGLGSDAALSPGHTGAAAAQPDDQGLLERESPDIIQVDVDPRSDSPLSSSVTNLDENKNENIRSEAEPQSSTRDDVKGDATPTSASNLEADKAIPGATSFASYLDGASASTDTSSSHNYYNTIQMSVPGQTSAGSGSGSRNVKQYQLDDGSVVSGKGLGRGRPGVKRGPRKSSLHGSTSGPSTPSMSQSASNSLASVKRRHTLTNGTKDANEDLDSDSSLSESRESTPEYNPTEETRSGRKIQKPPLPQPTVSQSVSPAAKRPKLENRNTGSASSPALKIHPKIKRRLYRGREQLALCEHCQRGHGPQGNAIVFCDACNKCWHQRCHDPQVPQSIVTDAKAEWYCSSCEKIIHGKKGKKPKAGENTTAKAQPPAPQFVGPLVGGAALTQAHKVAFLESRTKEQLISLILNGSDLAPALPMFQAPAPQLPQAQFKSNYTTPISSTPGLHNAGAGGEAEDEGYDSYFDDHAALYPKPGQGVKLPPDTADLHMLLEHPLSRTFSHWIRGMPTREYSGNADIVFQRQQ